MEHITSFDDFYEQKLSPFLKALEKQGSASYWWQVLCMVCTLGIIPVLAWGLRNESGILGGFLVLITIIVGIVSLHQYTKIKDSYESNYKEKVIQQIIEFIHPGLQIISIAAFAVTGMMIMMVQTGLGVITKG
jgi:hypothetical protein